MYAVATIVYFLSVALFSVGIYLDISGRNARLANAAYHGGVALSGFAIIALSIGLVTSE